MATDILKVTPAPVLGAAQKLAGDDFTVRGVEDPPAVGMVPDQAETSSLQLWS